MGISEPILRDEAGAEAALTRDLFDEYGRMVLLLCRALLRDGRDAEDAAQQTFLGAYRSILAGNRPSNPASWLATIARNECRARWAKKGEQTAPLPDDLEAAHVDPAEIAARREELAALAHFLAELPERQREVVILHCLDGLPYREVAEKLEISPRAVDGLLLRARRRLRSGIARAGAVVAPTFMRDRLAQLLPGAGESAGAVTVASGGGAGAMAAAGSTSVAAKVAVVSIGVAALGASAADTPARRTHAAQHRAQPVAQALESKTARTSLRSVSIVDERGRDSGRSGHGERRSEDHSSRGPGGGERRGSTSSGPGRSGLEVSGHSGPGRSESSGPGSGRSGSGDSESEGSGSGSGTSESGSSGSDGSGSGHSGPG